MSEPTKDYLDGYVRGIIEGRRELTNRLIEMAEASENDDYGFKKTILGWLKDVQRTVGGERKND